MHDGGLEKRRDFTGSVFIFAINYTFTHSSAIITFFYKSWEKKEKLRVKIFYLAS